jgi:hypothetical protein
MAEDSSQRSAVDLFELSTGQVHWTTRVQYQGFAFSNARKFF